MYPLNFQISVGTGQSACASLRRSTRKGRRTASLVPVTHVVGNSASFSGQVSRPDRSLYIPLLTLVNVTAGGGYTRPARKLEE